MKLEDLIKAVKSRVGYSESAHKDVVQMGVQLAYVIMAERISELEDQITRERKLSAERNDLLTGQLRTVAAIFHEHAPK